MHSISINKLRRVFPFKVFPLSDFNKRLGRWSINHTKEQTDHIVDWSNEDHCGPCGERKITSSSYSSSSYNPPPYRRLRI